MANVAVRAPIGDSMKSIAQRFLAAFTSHLLLRLELGGRQHADPRILALRVPVS